MLNESTLLFYHGENTIKIRHEYLLMSNASTFKVFSQLDLANTE